MDFEAQWSRPHTLPLGKEKVGVYDIKPDQQKGLPILFILGWGGTASVCKEHIRQLVQHDRRVIYVEAPHGIDTALAIPARAGHIAHSEVRRIASFMGALDALGVKQVDAAGDSQAAVDLLVAAAAYPERFRSIVLLNPEGLSGKEFFISLAVRYAWETIKGYARAYQAGRLKAFSKYVYLITKEVSVHPLLSFAEARAMAHADVSHLLPGIKNAGISLSLIYGKKDRVVRPEKLTTLPLFDKVQAMPGGHPDILIYINAYVKAIEDALGD